MSDSNTFDRTILQKLFRYACTLCANQDDAYDLVQYALEKFIQIESSSKPDNEVAFVRTIIRNRYIDQYRRIKCFPEESYDDEIIIAIDVASLEDIVIAQVDLDIIWKKLDPFERELMYYWAIEEMTAQEIASQIEVPRGTVLSRIYRIRKKIEATTDYGDISRGNRL